MDETFDGQDATTSPSDEGGLAPPSTTTSNQSQLFVLPPIAPAPGSVMQGPNHLDSDIRMAKRIVSFSLAFLMIGSLAYVGFILVDVGEITGYRPGASALEAQEVYVDMIQRDQVSLDGSGVTVCIVDSGLNTEHQDLKSLKVTKWKDFVGTSSTPYDDHGHGTSMAGLLVANGWMQGIAPNVNLLVAKALAENGSGDDSDVAKTIN